MEHTALRRALPKSTAHTIRFQSPLYVLIPLWLFLAIGLMTFGWIALVRRGAMTDPFSAYQYVFDGDYHALATRPEFDCYTDVFRSNDAHVDRSTNGYHQCTHNPTDGHFSRITVYSTYSTITGVTYVNKGTTRTTFEARERALPIGELAAMWGRPHIQYANGHVIAFTWPERGISASLQPSSRRLDYFLPVVSITFHEGARR